MHFDNTSTITENMYKLLCIPLFRAQQILGPGFQQLLLRGYNQRSDNCILLGEDEINVWPNTEDQISVSVYTAAERMWSRYMDDFRHVWITMKRVYDGDVDAVGLAPVNGPLYRPGLYIRDLKLDWKPVYILPREETTGTMLWADGYRFSVSYPSGPYPRLYIKGSDVKYIYNVAFFRPGSRDFRSWLFFNIRMYSLHLKDRKFLTDWIRQLVTEESNNAKRR